MSKKEKLTKREIEVLYLAAKGYSNNEIAEELSIVDGTVRKHLHSAFKKFNVKYRVQAALKAIYLGYFKLEEVVDTSK